MDYCEMIMITLQITVTFSKRHKLSQRGGTSGSDESIENLLYYKDCKHKKDLTTEAPMPMVLKQTAPPNDCPCPKMCCQMRCECNDTPPMVQRQSPMQSMLEPMSVMSPMLPPQPRQPGLDQMQSQMMMRGKKRKLKQKIDSLLPPIGGRRDFSGFTRENIKNLISKDEDIKKILKDLVSITMKKVDMKQVPKVAETNTPMGLELDMTDVPEILERYVNSEESE